MKPVRVTPQATRDVREARTWLKKQSRVAASQFIDALEDAYRLIAAQPGVGSLRHSGLVSEGALRMLPLTRHPYLIFYMEYPTHLNVLRVLHSSRDLPPLLSNTHD